MNFRYKNKKVIFFFTISKVNNKKSMLYLIEIILEVRRLIRYNDH